MHTTLERYATLSNISTSLLQTQLLHPAATIHLYLGFKPGYLRSQELCLIVLPMCALHWLRSAALPSTHSTPILKRKGAMTHLSCPPIFTEKMLKIPPSHLTELSLWEYIAAIRSILFAEMPRSRRRSRSTVGCTRWYAYLKSTKAAIIPVETNIGISSILD